MHELKLLTKAWLGDEETRFSLPAGWEATVYDAPGAPVLPPVAIGQALAQPTGCRRLAETAAGKRSAAIVVDDLTRPTPAGEVIPFILAELHAAGVPDDGISFVIGVGTHRSVTAEEAAKKVGAEIAARYPVICHEAFSGNLIGLGNLDDGTPLYLSEVVVREDVRIFVTSVIPHSGAGFGGGAKLVLPGVTGYVTTHYNHRQLPKRPRGLLTHAAPDDLRDGAVKAARRLGVDMSVNVVCDTRRRIVGVFAGDIEEAHDAACRYAYGVYETPIPKEAAQATDILIIDSYPQDNDTQCFYKSLWPREYFPNAYHVMINPCTDRVWFHGLTLGMDYARFLRLEAQRPPAPPRPRLPIGQRGQLLTLSEGYPPEEYYKRYPDAVLYAAWPELMTDLARVCPQAKVAVIPCAPLQMIRLE